MKLYNTLTRQVDEVAPIDTDSNIIKIYTCGLTVYSQPHIGNWVGYIYWDVMVRTLKASGYDVKRVQNITDVGHLVSDDDAGEDKMEKGARAEGITAWDVADKYIAIADAEAKALDLLPPDVLARATDFIPQQIAFVQELETKGFTYEIKDEGIYFDTSKLADYGKLAQLDIAGLQAGARVEMAGKKHPTDFALWKFSPKGKKRDMEWESPWGIGFPGWHLECSVIARENLGDQIDIHTGGIDHIPVHHTNEIAQTEAVTGKKPFAQIWLHNNHLKVNGQKMSKSLGNIYTLRDITNKGYSLTAFKVLILSKHYTTEGNFTWENLEAAAARLKKWQRAAVMRYQTSGYDEEMNQLQAQELDAYKSEILVALQDDLHSAKALEAAESGLEQARLRGLDNTAKNAFETYLKYIQELLGIDLDVTSIETSDKAKIDELTTARSEKNYETADRIKQDLLDKGIGLEITPKAVYWYWV